MWQNMVSRIGIIWTIKSKSTQRYRHQNEWIPKRICTNLQTNTQVGLLYDSLTSKHNLIESFISIRWNFFFWKTFALADFCLHTINSIAQIRFTIGDCAGGHRADNREKNRDVLCVPRKFIVLFFMQNLIYRSIFFCVWEWIHSHLFISQI